MLHGAQIFSAALYRSGYSEGKEYGGTIEKI
jgi:hypothetical protein